MSKAVGRRPLLIRNAAAYLSKTVHLDPVKKLVIRCVHHSLTVRLYSFYSPHGTYQEID